MNITKNRFYKSLFKYFVFSILFTLFITVRSYAKTVLTDDMVGSLNGYYEYTGNQHTPSVSILDPNEGMMLTENVDYKLTYGENINAGEGTVNVEGIGDYSGLVTKTFIIEPRYLFDYDNYMQNQIYTGNYITPSIDVFTNGVKLIDGTDYDIEYVDNVNVGTANAIINGKGNYYGTIYKYFNIEPAWANLSDVSISNVIYGRFLGASTIKGVAKDDNGNVLNGTFYFENPFYEPRLNESNSHKEVIRFISDDGNYRGVTTAVIPPASNWGNPTINFGENLGAMNWVDESGKTSAVIEDFGYITWLKEESIDHYDADGKPVVTSTWYGIENPLKPDGTRTFEPGSRFWVRWVNKNDADWDTYYNQLDPSLRASVDSGRLWIFLIGVTAPDGTEYKEFGMDVPVYIQLGDDWDKNDLNAIFIKPGANQPVPISYLLSDKIEWCPVNGAFAKLTLSHFSPYGIYDYDEKLLSNSSSGLIEKYNSGDNSNAEMHLLTIFLPTASLMLLSKKKKYLIETI